MSLLFSRFSLFFCGALMLFFHHSLHAQLQVSTSPSTTCISCNGEVALVFPSAVNTAYSLYNQNGLLLDSDVNTIGSTTFTGVCVGNYFAIADDGVSADTVSLNISVVGFEAGSNSLQYICSDQLAVDLIDLVDGSPDLGGTWTDPSGLTFTGVFDPLSDASGIYTYSIDAGGCTVASETTIEVNENANPGNTTTYLICEDYEPFYLTDVMAGSPDPGGVWHYALNAPFDGIFDPDSMDTGIFLYIIDSVPGCDTVFSTIYVIKNLLPDPGIDTDIFVCDNGTAFNLTDQLDGTPQPNGQWYNTSNTPIDSIFDPTIQSEGIYRYRVPGMTPCVAQEAYLTITYTDSIYAGTSGFVQLCSIDSSVVLFNYLGDDPDDNGTWSGPSVIDSVFNPTTHAPGVYTYTVEGVGCVPVSSEVNVEVDVQLMADADTPQNICELVGTVDLNTLLTDPVDGTWEFNGNVIPPNFSIPLFSDSLEFVFYTAQTYCTPDTTAFTLIIDHAPIAVNDGENSVCSNIGPLNLNDVVSGDPMFESAWYNALLVEVDSIYDPLINGNANYYFVQYAANSCPNDTAEISMLVEFPAFENQDSSFTVCGSNQVIDLLDFSIGFPLGGNWYDNNGDTISTIVVLTDSIPESNYFYIYDNGATCSPSIYELSIQVMHQPDAGPDQEVTLCVDGPTLDLNELLMTDDVGFWVFQGDTLTESMLTPSDMLPGVYYFNAPAIQPCITDVSAITIDFDPGYEMPVLDDYEICDEQGPLQIGAPIDPSYSIAWSPEENLTNPSSPTPYFIPYGGLVVDAVEQYVLTISNGICTYADSLEILIHPLPQVDAGENETICSGDSLVLSASGAASYQWTPVTAFEDSFDPQQILWPLMNQTFILNGLSEYGCFAQDSIAIIVNPKPSTSFEFTPESGCAPVELDLINLNLDTNLTSYTWYVGDVMYEGSSLNLTIMEEGEYIIQLEAINQYNCQSLSETSEVLVVHELPTADFEYAPNEVSILDPTVNFINLSDNASFYHWSMQSSSSQLPNPTYVFPTASGGHYPVCLEAISNFGCRDTLCKLVLVSDEFFIYVPNAFTPDNDGRNDFFSPEITGVEADDFVFQIFDRWGTLIFESNDLNARWIGDVRGGTHYAAHGVYAWRIEVRPFGSVDILTFNGHVTLIR